MNLKEVFLSYSHEDNAVAGRIKKILETYGVSAFLAHEDLEVSSQWRAEILHHLDTCSALIAIVTHNSSKSAWCNQELGIAIGKKLTPIPLLIGPSELLQGFLESYQAETVTDSNLDAVVKSLVPRINAGLSSVDRNVWKGLKIVLGRLMLRWQAFMSLPSNDKWTQPTIDEIQRSFEREREELLRIVADGTGMDAGAINQVQVIVSQISRFTLYSFNIRDEFRNRPFAPFVESFQELEHRGNQVIETTRALDTWITQTQRAS